jgi:hypothetical protein
VTLTIKYAAESLVKRQIKLWGVLKGSVETHDGTPTNSDSSICDLVLAKQFEGLG